LIQRPLVRSNLKGLNQTRSPCGTQGSSSLWTAMSGSPIAAITCSVRSSVKALSSLSAVCSVALCCVGFNPPQMSGEPWREGSRLVPAGVDTPDPTSVSALLVGAYRVCLEDALNPRRGNPGMPREVERARAADVR
jgi:hypothetical protein